MIDFELFKKIKAQYVVWVRDYSGGNEQFYQDYAKVKEIDEVKLDTKKNRKINGLYLMSKKIMIPYMPPPEADGGFTKIDAGLFGIKHRRIINVMTLDGKTFYYVRLKHDVKETDKKKSRPHAFLSSLEVIGDIKRQLALQRIHDVRAQTEVIDKLKDFIAKAAPYMMMLAMGLSIYLFGDTAIKMLNEVNNLKAAGLVCQANLDQIINQTIV